MIYHFSARYLASLLVILYFSLSLLFHLLLSVGFGNSLKLVQLIVIILGKSSNHLRIGIFLLFHLKLLCIFVFLVYIYYYLFLYYIERERENTILVIILSSSKGYWRRKGTIIYYSWGVPFIKCYGKIYECGWKTHLRCILLKVFSWSTCKM